MSHFLPPLCAAAACGFTDVVKLFTGDFRLDVEIDKAEVNLKDDSGRTPLSWAAQNGHESTIKLLLVTGKADVDSKDDYGGTPLSWAAENGREAVIKLLLATGKANVDSKR